jgi:hypothetical protein
MKKVIVVVLVFACLFMATASYAAETKVSVSLKGWYNSWEEEDDTTGQTFDFGSALLVGPAINVKFGNGVFLGGSFMKSTSDYESTNVIFIGDTLTIERQDVDLTAGYMFNPYFGAFIGYKSIEGDATLSMGGSSADLGTLKLTGPGVGIMGNYAFNEMIALYGSLAFMKIDYEFEPAGGGTTDTDDLTGASFEIGLAFAFTQNFSGNIGIKSQSFSGDFYTDTFTGPTFGLTYTF